MEIQVPKVTTIVSEGKGIQSIEMMETMQKINNLTDNQRDALITSIFAKVVEESLRKNSNQGLVEVLQHCNLFPSVIPEGEEKIWNRRIFLFRIAFDQMSKVNAPSAKTSSERRDWKNKDTLNRFLDCVKESKTGSYQDIGDRFGNLAPGQVAGVFKALREGKYAGVGFPAKEYDTWLPRSKGPK